MTIAPPAPIAVAPAAATKPPVTSKTASFNFYDIESLKNVFSLCAYSEKKNTVNVFYLVDPTGTLGDEIARNGFDQNQAGLAILKENPSFQNLDGKPRQIFFQDLSTFHGNLALADMFGLSDADSVNNPASKSSYTERLRPVCDTDPHYDPFDAHPYLAGYNSQNYDTSMLALYLMEAFAHLPRAVEQGQRADFMFSPPKASMLRSYNDDLFSDQYRKNMPRYLIDGRVAGGKGYSSTPSKIRTAMLRSGRHIDVSNFNEAQRMVGLKRQLGGLGRQILESNKLEGHNAEVHTLEDLYELLAYNVSDTIGLKHVFRHPTYSSGFDLKKSLLDEYPETIYERSKITGKPDVDPSKVRFNRLTPDTTSAKLVAMILSPYGSLSDIPSVSFMYPSERVAKERGIQRVNVLEECRKFFYESISDPIARAQFDAVYGYYKSIEGQNFNDSENYAGTYGPSTAPLVLKDIPKAATNLPYFNADGSPSTCFATFSTGGIHGAEANWQRYEEDLAEWEVEAKLINDVMAEFPDPLVVRTTKGGVTLSDGRVIDYKQVLKPSSTIKDLKARSEALAMAGEDAPAEQVAAINQQFEKHGYREAKSKPELFEVLKDGSNKLKPKYTFTSMATAIHEDFTSYYPNLLRETSAFYNADLGEDRYAKILADKDRYGRMMKDPSISAEERTRLGVLRNGTKLILNSASGAGDTTFGKSPIRVNNAIVSMRLIGQLFSWRIGQAQTLAGARIVSTNTDGLYSVLDEETNNRVLAEQQAQINVAIEPEPLIIVSKDSNNRLELHVPDEGVPIWEAPIISASGGTLACHEEPQPTKSLAHPAVLDWALARYLRYVVGEYVPDWRTTPVGLSEPLDRTLGKQLMLQAVRDNDPVLVARLFQNVIAASNGKITLPFAADPVDPVKPDPSLIVNPRPMQHFSRVFFVHPGKPGAVSIRSAGAWVVPATSKRKRLENNEASVQTDPIALSILQQSGFARSRVEANQTGRTLIDETQDVSVRKWTKISPSWNALIENGDLVCMDKGRLAELLGCLDLDVYVDMLAEVFEKNWMNKLPGYVAAETDDDDEG